jgi:mlo protein
MIIDPDSLYAELMLLGFISLLLTVGQSTISNICISKKAGATWHPCNKKEEAKLNGENTKETDYENRRKLLSISAGESLRRVLAAGESTDKCAAKVFVFLPFVRSKTSL